MRNEAASSRSYCRPRQERPDTAAPLAYTNDTATPVLNTPRRPIAPADLGPPGGHMTYSAFDCALSGIVEGTARYARQEGIGAAPCSSSRLPISGALIPAAVGMLPGPGCPVHDGLAG